MEKVSFASPSHENNVATEDNDIEKSMSQISLKYGEIKWLKEENQKLKQEVAQRSEKSEQVQKENDFLQEKIAKLNSRIK
jgi:FtsZ-binding cell division protein ZapB